MTVFIVDLSAKAIVRRHRSLHVYADTENEAIRKTKSYFEKSLQNRNNQLVGEINVDSVVDVSRGRRNE